MRGYIHWALEHTRDRAVILIPDSIEAINIQHRERRNPSAAERLARKRGDEIQDELERMRDGMVLEMAELLDIRRWDDVGEGCKRYDHNLEVIEAEFLRKQSFYRDVRVFIDYFADRAAKTIPEESREQMCYYFLREAAGLFGGFEYKREDETLFGDLLLYPIMAEVQKLIIDVQNGQRYGSVTKKLELETRLGAISLRPKGEL